MTARWVRLQIEAGRLAARVLLTGPRPTYRIRLADLDWYVARVRGLDRLPVRGVGTRLRLLDEQWAHTV